MENGKKCLLCKSPIDDHRDYCTPCFQKKISEIEEEYGERGGPFNTRKDEEEAPSSEPLEQGTATHYLS